MTGWSGNPSIQVLPRSAAVTERRREVVALTLAWGLLLLNTLTFSGLPTVVPIPGPIGTLVTQGSLVAAAGVAMALNPRLLVRPNLFLLLLTFLSLVAVLTSLHSEFLLGSTYRAGRYALFIAVLWLLTPFWGRSEEFLLKAHSTVLAILLGSVLAGFLLSPGAALSYSGRLSGTIWPMTPTQVAHYASVFFGIVAVGWLLGRIRGRWAVLLLGASAGILVATHTRTALVALLVGLVLAVTSLLLGHRRVRRISAMTAVLGLTGAVALAPVISAWFLRGVTFDELSELTGRSGVWEEVLASSRSYGRTLFGTGMSNASFNGRPIDSNWVATYVDLGLVGVVLQVVAIFILAVTAIVRPRGHARAVAIFLLAHFVVSSFTEVGLNSPTTRLLDLVVAASLLARPPGTGSSGVPPEASPTLRPK